MSDLTDKADSLPAGAGEVPVKFIADARLISILGEQLIGSEKVGILELVKNAYDAGAQSCTVTLEGVPTLDPPARTLVEYETLAGPIIEIRDDGSGMTGDDLVNGWLRPATPSRSRVKKALRDERAAATAAGTLDTFNALVGNLKKAHGGRLPLGEKGIGRLATHRLGQFLWLRTKTVDDPLEWELRVDWNLFDSADGTPMNLDSVRLTLKHQPTSTTYGHRGSGTVICCYGGRRGYLWTKDLVKDVGLAMAALKSPRKAPDSFDVHFSSPHVAETEFASPLDKVPAPFELTGLVEEDGTAELEVTFKPPGLLKEPLGEFTRTESLDLRRGAADYWGKDPKTRRSPACGPFTIHVRCWLRHPKWLGPDHDPVAEYLDTYGGIAIYRDGLATVPAQQAAKQDWLGLTLTARKKSTNITYYQLVGEVEIQQEHTPDLRDRASREGLIETKAERDLGVLTRACIDQLQQHVLAVRDEWTTKAKTRVSSPATVRLKAKQLAGVAQAIAANYDFRKDTLQLAAVVGSKKPAERIADAANTLRQLGDVLKLQEEEREGLLEAAGFGLAIGVAVHELAKLASAIIADVRLLQGTIGPGSPGTETLESLRSRSQALLAEVKRLAPLRVTRGEASRSFSIRSAIEAARNAFVHSLKDAQILLHVERGDFEVTGRFGAVAQVFANLFDNSLYWIGTDGTGGAIQVGISPTTRTVTVGDSGPGISEKMLEHAFEPFYSEKSPPSGLGLYICRHYLSQCDATIRVARPTERSNLRGAQFVLDFSKSQAGEP